MGIAAAFEHRVEMLDLQLDTTPIRTRPVEVVVQGTGTWVTRAIQPDLTRLHADLQLRDPVHPGLVVSYVGIDKESPLTLDGSFETYYCRDDEDDVEEIADRRFDLVIIATPDYAHIDDVRRWLRHACKPKAILVEKPFSDESFAVDGLATEIAEKEAAGPPMPPVLGVDHYNLYLAQLKAALDRVDEFLPGMSSVAFMMLEKTPIEHERLPSLKSGISFDMGSHLLGILSVFADLATHSDVNVPYSSRHKFEPYRALRRRRYFAETAVETSFDVRLWNENRNVSAYARVGKAASVNGKFLEFSDGSGRVVRFDFSPRSHAYPDYPYGGVLFATKHTSKVEGSFPDPFEQNVYFKTTPGFPPAKRLSRPWTRHGLLVDSLITGNFEAYSFLLSLDEADRIICVLEAIRDDIIRIDEHPPAQQQWSMSWPEG